MQIDINMYCTPNKNTTGDAPLWQVLCSRCQGFRRSQELPDWPQNYFERVSSWRILDYGTTTSVQRWPAAAVLRVICHLGIVANNSCCDSVRIIRRVRRCASTSAVLVIPSSSAVELFVWRSLTSLMYLIILLPLIMQLLEQNTLSVWSACVFLWSTVVLVILSLCVFTQLVDSHTR